MRKMDSNFAVLCGIPVVSHTIVIGSGPLMQMSCKGCIAFWILSVLNLINSVPVNVYNVHVYVN